MTAPTAKATAAKSQKKPFYTSLSNQVLFGIAVAIVLGYVSPAKAIAMKPLGDAFIRLITMIITLVIFCTVVSGIAGMQDMKKVGRVGGKALLYFEVVSTFALILGLVSAAVLIPNTAATILGMPSAGWVPGAWVDVVLVLLGLIPILVIFTRPWVVGMLRTLRESEVRVTEGIADLPERPLSGERPLR